MESPDNLSVRLAPPECQGSPIYNFLCNLSPIKLAKSVHVVNTYTDLSFPPPAVFLTPKADQRRESSSHEKNKETSTIEHVESQTRPTISVQNESGPCKATTFQGLRKLSNTQGKVDSPVNSPTKIVEQYLSEPTDAEPGNEDIPTTSDREQFRLHSNVVRPTERRVSFKEDNRFEAANSFKASHQALRGNDNEKLILENNESDSNMSFALSENCLEEESWQDQTSSALSELSIEQITGSFPVMGNLLSQEPQQMETDCLPAQLKDDVVMSDLYNDKQIPPGSKVKSSLQRGVRRRCLDFEDDQRKSIKVSSSTKLPKNSPRSTLTDISDAPAHLRILRERALANSGATNSDYMNSGFEITPDKATVDALQQQTPASILTGVRLYHNDSLHSYHSIQVPGNVCAMASHDVEVQCGEGNIDMLENTSCHKNSGDDYNIGSTPNFIRGMVQKATKGERKCEEHVFDPIDATQKSDGPTASNEKRDNSVDHNNRTATLEASCQIDRSQEECDQSPQSPKKRRKSISASEKSGDGCKRCNCKKSKCLKLYCECFAAGVYCVDSCSCQGCQNKPSFEETVLETRQQIESRNPLAFAPKVVVTVSSDVSPGEHENGETPASARHKRGCNCKRSKCLKKYCECYQSGVGCSEGCRCENCQNIYGRKEGQKDFEDKDVRSGTTDKEATEEESDLLDSCKNPSNATQQRHPDLSPITPSLEYIGQNRSTAIHRTANSRRFSYEELQSPTFLLSTSKPSKTPSRLLRSSNDDESPIILFTDNQLSCSPMLTQETSSIGQFSPGWEGLADICSLTPLPHAQGNAAPASGICTDGNIDNSPSFNVQQYNDSQGNVGNDKSRLAQRSLSLCHHVKTYNSDSAVKAYASDSLEGAPVTPTCVPSPKPMQGCSTTVIDKELLDAVDGDATPDFLQGLGVELSPLSTINSTSPKQKRISPAPHRSSRSKFDKSHPSLGFGNGRKLILQSVLPSD